MRVVAGEFKGRRLVAPRGSRTRPTADRVREALSRGAESAVFVERDRAALAALARNLEATGAPGEVRRQDVARFLARQEGTFDLVFCDPPYDGAPAIAATLAAALPEILDEDARIVTESDKRNPLVLPLPLVVERSYGDTRIAIHSAT